MSLTLAAVVLAAGCTQGDEESPSRESVQAPSEVESAESPEPEPEPSEGSDEPSASPEPSASVAERPLPEEWYVDSDGNGVPDFVEVEAGYDPEVDDCAMEVGCAGPDGRSPLELVTREQNTVVVLDASGSMAGDAGGGQSKIEAARAALERYVTGTPEFVNLGFVVYGHLGSNEPSGKAESCAGVEVAAGLGEVDFETFPGLVGQFQPTGFTPIAGALEVAGGLFEGVEEGASNRVILVSDGIETCDGDPVAVAQQLAAAGVAVTVDVVGFDVGEGDAAQLRAVAEATGGTYTDAQTGQALQDFFGAESARIFELVQQAGCFIEAYNDYFLCSTSFINDVSAVFQDLYFEATDEGESNEFVDALGELERESVAQFEELEAATLESLDADYEQVERQRVEAEQRLRDAYGEEVSSGFVCPLDEVAVAAGGSGLSATSVSGA